MIMNRHFVRLGLPAIAFLTAINGGTAAADEVLRPGNDINCSNLTSPVETADRVLARYGSQARRQEVRNTESEPFDAIVLYPDEPQLRLEVEIKDWGTEDNVSMLNLREKNSRWSMFGLTTGMTLEQVTAANGKPLKLSGFWPHPNGSSFMYGFYKPDQLEGGCDLMVSFTAPAVLATDDPLYGREEILSNDPDLIKRKPLVSALFITWNKPRDK